MKKSANDVWDCCLSYIKDNINKESFSTWFLPIKPIKIKDDILTIQVPSKFFYEWIEEHYIDLLKSAVRKELGAESKLVYSIMMENTNGNSVPYTIKVPSINKKNNQNVNLNLPPEVVNDEIKIRPIMYLALSYDHRIIDGKESVSFLKMIKENLEDPRRLFLDI